jgi:hypothetical protein
MMTQKKDFKIKDKRIFTGDDQTDKAPEKEAAAGEEKSEQTAAEDKSKKERKFQLPEINFSTFIFSLNSSALLHLGVIEDPNTGQKTKDLPLAKQTIDILGMLEEKTKGNLTEDEAGILKNFLYELRMLYVKAKG